MIDKLNNTEMQFYIIERPVYNLKFIQYTQLNCRNRLINIELHKLRMNKNHTVKKPCN